jgi:lipoprotein-anchoring transpeptidase ErfK/SrfK
LQPNYKTAHLGVIMKKQILKTIALVAVFLSVVLVYGEAQAQEVVAEAAVIQDAATMEELDPQAANIEEVLKEMDKEYLRQTGQLPYIMPSFLEISCQRYDCPIYVEVRKSEQRLYLYVRGALTHTWLVSTGAPKSETPLWQGHPNGRIYDKYSSKANPGGDYKGLGNMPYAVFLSGGYAIHGTVESNFKHLGKKASHGCVRVHPDNGYIFNRFVRQYGVDATWVSIIN